MQIKVNGKSVPLENTLNIKELLIFLKVENQEYVTVQVNEDLVDSEDFEKTIIKEGDNIEFIYFMGGGK